MVALAATSTKAMLRRLGRRRPPLHRLICLGRMPAALPYPWQVRHAGTIAFIQPVDCASMQALPLRARLPDWLGGRNRAGRAARDGSARKAHAAQ